MLSRTIRTGTMKNNFLFKSKNNIKKHKKAESLSDLDLGKNDNKDNNENIKFLFNNNTSNIIEHIINDTMKEIKNYRNYRNENQNNIIEYYNANNGNRQKENELINAENEKINQIISSIIPIIEKEIKKYSSSSLFNTRKLFNKDYHKYKINLNIDNLLLINENDEKMKEQKMI